MLKWLNYLFLAKKKKNTLYFDPTLAAPRSSKRRHGLNFLQAGSVVKKAEKMREMAKKEEKKEEKKITDIEESKELTTKKQKEPIPDVEWWDKFLLQNPDSYPTGEIDKEKIKIEEITIYVEHPIPIKPPGEPDNPPPIPMFLTKKEQKKLRRKK
jgi:U4/U6 small nuclear ribonucleoprotein PRP3